MRAVAFLTEYAVVDFMPRKKKQIHINFNLYDGP